MSPVSFCIGKTTNHNSQLIGGIRDGKPFFITVVINFVSGAVFFLTINFVSGGFFLIVASILKVVFSFLDGLFEDPLSHQRGKALSSQHPQPQP